MIHFFSSCILTCIALSAMTQTKLVMLGTGTPFADPERSGPSLAIVVNDQSYVVDCGPGVVRRASSLSKTYPALAAKELKRLFITHLHTDHTVGYPDMIFTPAVLDRNAPLNVYGPKGLKSMTNHILKAYKEDIVVRVKGLEMGNANAYKVNVVEVKPGLVYQDELVKVHAFNVSHGSWKHAFGYRFETPDKVIVVSGDATYSQSLVENAKNCDILVHEIFSQSGLDKREERWKRYHSTFHTSPSQLAEIANQVKPKLLVLTHLLFFGESKENLLEEVKKKYKGLVALATDLDVYE
ncbi:MAG: MBL fold metallo-hydrolase [Chitinophagaceae bacterium]|jgi:ribonuclease BN (tRNA processing enzyme)